MAFTTLTALATALSGLTVSGVTKAQTAAPLTVNTADLPLLFTRLPTQASQTVTLNGNQSLRQGTMELVILIEPVRQDLNSLNYGKALALADAVYTALAANVVALGLDEFSSEVIQDAVGNSTYWMLVTTVQVS